ncbi:bifunctional 23S rRNA (guanine(2069)-N(7))-methyltransferase RlmK/23S rRNA (guanine(2445)-N(2))-methyltransferase RlmL [bacterium]|nr:bifunctional 23S rRNA (guanine(2069)-N(7))-methyltransferase RlmK/23S rRNA (guanine(2445)-N(2))-methyltransferase RlmL [candidate division CSSED10-310 bacterium]
MKSAEYGSWFATVPLAMEGLLAEEIRNLGGTDVRECQAGVSFNGPLRVAYRVLMWSRLASRLLHHLAVVPGATRDALYRGAYSVDWMKHMSETCPFMVKATGSNEALHYSEFIAQVVKDAVVDRIRACTGGRPPVDIRNPGITVHCRINREEAVLAVDICSGVLHRRGYRAQQGSAPLRENVAAAMVIRAGWPDAFPAGAGLVDPMCGAGTIAIEAALIAGDIAPGIVPGAAGLNAWKGHNATEWMEEVEEATLRRRAGVKNIPAITGSDRDPELIGFAQKNAARAQVEYAIRFECRDIMDVEPPEGVSTGLIAANPPYGRRLNPQESIEELYGQLGSLWVSRFPNWKVVMITDEASNARAVGLRASRINTIYNGGIPCVLAQFDLTPDNEYRPYRSGAGRRYGLEPMARARGSEAEAFRNRLTKNRAALRGWLKRSGITCYRVYDADLPNFAIAIDVYDERWCVVQEYAPPASIDPVKANDRMHEALAVIPEVLTLDPDCIYLKRRARQKGAAQYGKSGDRGQFDEISEGKYRFLVNFTDYLDTGIFLDHRPIRSRIESMAHGRSFLNLFCYTGTATVYAAGGGARFTRSVDASGTYLGWTESNLRRNGFDTRRHPLIHSDCMEWLNTDTDRYDLIFCDPPTHSVSKDRRAFNVQKDHVALILKAMRRLNRNGIMIFSTNFRKFRMDSSSLAPLIVRDITKETIPRDFQRNPRIHGCWLISAAGE